MDTQADSDASSILAPRPSFGRVAVIHDWLTGMRGGEEVLEGILDIVPEAEIFTLFHFPGSVSKAIESRTIRTSRLQNVARRAHDYRELLPLFPGAVRRWVRLLRSGDSSTTMYVGPRRQLRPPGQSWYCS